MSSRHLKRFQGTYCYGRYRGIRGSDWEKHLDIERMSLIRGYKEAVVTTSTSPTIPEMTTMVRTAAAGEDDLELEVYMQPCSLC